MTRSNDANETQLKLLHDDLDVLRKKLETKNLLLESREKSVKKLEKELEVAKSHSQEQLHSIQVILINRNKNINLNIFILKENEHRIIQLTYRIDQLETLLREKDALTYRLKQRLLQSPDTRAEAELQQKLENMDKDKESLEKAIDTLRQNSEIEKQNQVIYLNYSNKF